jgi:hypothetical protein
LLIDAGVSLDLSAPGDRLLHDGAAELVALRVEDLSFNAEGGDGGADPQHQSRT